MKTILLGFAAMITPLFAGTLTSLDKTPPELAGNGITYEKAGFKFDHPVNARFWIEYDAGDGSKIATMDVPHDHAKPAAEYQLVLVQTNNEQATLTAITRADFPLDRRSGSLGGGDDKSGSREVECALKSLDVPLDQDLVIYTSSVKPSWRNPEKPTKQFVIKARFTAAGN